VFSSVLGLLVGLAVLTVAAELFVAGAVRLAARLQLSTVIIGAVVIGFGTSAPEMVVSALAASQGDLDLAVGNIIGSNVANLSLVLGASALVVPVVVASPTIRREAPLALAATVLFAWLVQGGITTVEATVLMMTLLLVMTYLVTTSRAYDPEISSEVEEYLKGNAIHLPRESLRTLFGLVGTVAAAQLLVVSARDLAATLGLAEGFVGLTIVAVGTSLPELATSLTAARKGETDLIVGNLLGSNLFNSLGVAGLAGIVGPGEVGDPALTGLAVALMVGVGVLATTAMATDRAVVRWEGGALLVVWLVMIPFLA
jgi:cation:H+ antiporter